MCPSNIVKYRISDEGKTLIATERFHGPFVRYDDVWVFDKK